MRISVPVPVSLPVCVELDNDSVDHVVITALKNQSELLKNDLKSSWIHPDDVKGNKKLIKAMKLIVDYYSPI